MASDEASDDGKDEFAFSVILERLKMHKGASLTSEEADLILRWASECDSPEKQAELLQIFELAGGRAALELLARRLH